MTMLGLIADLIKGFQQGVETLEDAFVLDQFLHHDHRLRWQFSWRGRQRGQWS